MMVGSAIRARSGPAVAQRHRALTLKANAPALAIPVLGVNSRVSSSSFAPEEHDKDHAHHGQKWRYQFHPRIPHAPPLGAREGNNVVKSARSQVGLIRHADQEIHVRRALTKVRHIG